MPPRHRCLRSVSVSFQCEAASWMTATDNGRLTAYGRLGEFANGSFGAVQFAKPGFD